MGSVLLDARRLSLSLRSNDVSPTDLSPIVQVVTWLLLAVVTLLLGFRQLTRFYIKVGKPFGWEDSLIIVSYLFGIGENVTILIPEGRVIGKEMLDISKGELIGAEKASYARDLLFILCLGCSKLSVSTGLFSLSPDRSHRRMMYGLQLFMGGWMLSSFLAIAFQCGAHGPWDKDIARCGNKQSILQYVAIVNILTDVALLVIPVVVIGPLKMTLQVKLTVLAFYTIRLLVVAATIVQLVYVPPLSQDDSTLRSLPYYLSMQIVEFTSITASCAVYFWPLFRSLQSGFMLANSPEHTRPHTTVAATKGSSLQYIQPSISTQDSNRRSRSGYIEITTNIDIRHTKPPEDGVPDKKYAWELKEMGRKRQGA